MTTGDEKCVYYNGLPRRKSWLDFFGEKIFCLVQLKKIIMNR